MRPFRLILALLALTSIAPIAAFATNSGSQASAGNSDVIPGQYIVVLKGGASPAAVARAHGVAADFTYTAALNGFAFRGSAQAAQALSRNPNVEYVVADRVLALVDPLAAKSSSGAAQAAQIAPTGLQRIGGSSDGVDQTLSNTGNGVGVAVIDTGIDLSHPDLQGVVAAKSCIRGKKTPNDDNGHGTHVAGTIAARDNGIGSVGVAPQATLYAVKVLNWAGSGSWSSVICGIDWVAKNAGIVDVANMSLGGGGASDGNCGNTNNDALHKAICGAVTKGVTFVVAAGNSAANASTFVPAAYEEVITVSALSDSDGLAGGLGGAPTCSPTEQDDTFADFSNFGAPVDIAAPGVCIFSLWKGGGYNTISGTSMASPHVAGAAALYIAGNSAATPEQVKAALVAASNGSPITGDPDSSKEGVVHIQ